MNTNKKIFIAQFLVCLTSISAHAEEKSPAHVPTIREDRVWEYVRYDEENAGQFYHVERIRVRFNGLQDINGKTYHKLIYEGGECEDFKGIYDNDSLVYSSSGFTNLPDSPDWLPCLMREENGIVYRYDEKSGDEMATLNFNLHETGDSSVFYHSVNDNFTYMEGTNSLILKCETSIEIDGEVCRNLTVELGDKPYGYDHELHLIEGIGLVDEEATGTLAYPGLTWYLSGFHQHSNYILNNVYDVNGKVIYCGANWNPSENSNGADGAYTYSELFEDGKTWNIIEEYYDYHSKERFTESKTVSVVKKWNDGEHLLTEINRIINATQESDSYFYLEENRILYADCAPVWRKMIDFNLCKGDEIMLEDSEGVPIQPVIERHYYIINDEIVEIRGIKRRILSIGTEKDGKPFTYWIEGIGAVDNWIMLEYPQDCCPPVFLSRQISSCYVNDKCIFSYEDLEEYISRNGVGTIEMQNTNDNYIYDMMGRRIREPEPGQLYIRNGKKLIGR